MKHLSPNPIPNPFPKNPCECAEERSFKRIRASDCLSAGEFPYFGEAKKGKSPAAATERHRDLADEAVTESTAGFDRSARSFDTSGRTGGQEQGLTLRQAQDRQAQSDPSIPQDERGTLSPILQYLRTNVIPETRAFSGSKHKFPEPSSRPAGAAQRNCDPTLKTRQTPKPNSKPALDQAHHLIKPLPVRRIKQIPARPL